ncbi:MAG: hypothetical protein M1833_002777 [Piccolia ochrophora]|nr:MAG: hypothetical protein M1833_002777 [Piccolia ochrophora]
MSRWELEDTEDDLDITKAVKSGLSDVKDYIDIGRGPGFQSTSEQVTASQSAHHESQPSFDANEGERIEWSEDDGEDVYKKFKGRKSLKRKRAAASTRKAKAKSNPTARQDVKGKRAAVAQHGDGERDDKQQPQERGSDDDLMEDTLPDYLRNRKCRFDKNKERLKEVGLRLPPSFDGIDFSDDERLEHLAEKPDFKNTTRSAPYKDITLEYSLGVIPAPLAQWLRSYQVQGVAFLHELFVYQRGGILGDDMGLGKTIQVIAFLTAAFGKSGDERDAKRMRKMRRAKEKPWYPRALVVCPGSLIENWKNELATWGWWNVDTYHGDSSSKEAALDAAVSGRLEVMITTYATYRLNKGAINMVEWDCVIADECHQVKERSSEITKAMTEVNALCRIGLTGTAIQNNYEELWTLLNWTNPGRFGPLSTWKVSISDPLKIGQSHDATVHQLSKARKTAKKLVENLLPQFFLRRMKSLIADQLPKKSDRVVFCPLTQTQSEAYETFLSSDTVQYVKTSSEKCDCTSGKKRGWCCYMRLPNGVPWQTYIFSTIMALQKISNHLALLIPRGTDQKEKQSKDLELLQATLPDQWKDLARNRDSILNFSNPEFCGKWRVLKKLLKFWHNNGDKVLVFSHSKRLLRMLQSLFNHTSYNVSYLDGEMSYEDRAITVDEFNSDSAQFVFLISTKAGGVGLNITSANKVVVVDPNWNPSYDLQAQDRAYRIGQVRDVEVFRLVSAGTIEEIVYARQIYKQQQANIGYNASSERRYFTGVQLKSDRKGEIFGLVNLFAYHADNVVLRDIVNKTNVAESKAGVSVVGFDVDDAMNDDDDPLGGDKDAEDIDGKRVMSQLAALVAGQDTPPQPQKGKPAPHSQKTDAINAILSAAGVDYTHENSEVIGPSAVEAHLSRRAEEAGNDLDLAETSAFPAMSSVTSSTNRGPNTAGGRFIHKYHPPADVMKRQFCTMARTFGFQDATEFALVVEGWTQAQRRRCLERFYRERRGKPENTNERGTNEKGETPARENDDGAVTTGDDQDPDSEVTA